MLRTKAETFMLGHVGYLVLNSLSSRFPPSSTATPFFLSSSALFRKSLMNCFSSASITGNVRLGNEEAGPRILAQVLRVHRHAADEEHRATAVVNGVRHHR